MKYPILILLFVSVSTLPLQAQRRSKTYDVNSAYPWVSGNLPSNSDVVRYKVAYGEGTTYQMAKEDATASLIMELGWEHGITVASKTIDEISHTINNNDGVFLQKRNTTTVIEQDGYSASITKVDEYSELEKDSSLNIKYKVWQLYAIDCAWASQIKLYYSTNYGFDTAGWRSLIIPGWGQMYKKQYIKGVSFLGAELVGITSSMYFQNRRNYNLKKSLETPILDLQIEYTNRAHKQQLCRNISIGSCVALWVLNVLDATLFEGRPRYVESSDFDVNFSTTDNNVSFNLTYKF